MSRGMSGGGSGGSNFGYGFGVEVQYTDKVMQHMMQVKAEQDYSERMSKMHQEANSGSSFIFAGDKFETQMARKDVLNGSLDAKVYQASYNRIAAVNSSLFTGFAFGGLAGAIKLGRGWSILSREVEVAKGGTLLLGAAPARLTQQGLEHIVARHWFSSGAKGAGKFLEGTTVRSLTEMIETATTQGTFRVNTFNRLGTIAEYNFSTVIGSTSGGAPASSLRVVIGTNGNVITAFPF